MMISGIDGTIVATALPSIIRDLGGVSGIAWVVERVPLVPWSRPCRSTARSATSTAASACCCSRSGCSSLGSMACGFAQSMPQLLAARAVQGLGGGGLPVLGMAILGDLVPPRQLGRWLGYQGMLFAVAIVDRTAARWVCSSTTSAGAGRSSSTCRSRSSPSPSSCRACTCRTVGSQHSIDYLGSLFAHRRARRARGARDRRRQGRRLGVAGVGGAPGRLPGAAQSAFVWRERHAAEPFVPLRLFQNAGAAHRGAGQLHVGPRSSTSACSSCRCSSRRSPGVDATASGLLLIPFMIGTAAVDHVRRSPGRAHRPLPGLADRRWRRDDGGCARAHHHRPRHVGRARRRASGPIVGIGIGFAMQTSLLAVQNAVDLGRHGHGDVDRDAGADARRHGGDAAVRRGARRRTSRRTTPPPPSSPTRCPWVFACAVPVGLLALLFGVPAPAPRSSAAPARSPSTPSSPPD